MIAIRQQAYQLIDAIPDEKLSLIVDILQAFKRNENIQRKEESINRNIDFSKYMGRGRKMFADTEAITKIIIQDKENRKIELSKKEDSIWLVNSKYEANKVLVDIVLSTFKNMRIREPLPKASRNNVVKDIATIGKQIDIYTIDYKIRFWFIY